MNYNGSTETNKTKLKGTAQESMYYIHCFVKLLAPPTSLLAAWFKEMSEDRKISQRAVIHFSFLPLVVQTQILWPLVLARLSLVLDLTANN
jgi:hypothetical protein